jgi:hypothetical protein
MTTDPRAPERTFGLSFGLLCGLIALGLRRHGHEAAALACASAGTLTTLIGLSAPRWLQAPSRVWWRGLRALGWVNSRVILTLFFFVIVTPVGLILRGTGWDPLRRRRLAAGAGNWQPYPERHRSTRHYEQMF